MTAARRFFIENLGCAKNQVDAEEIASRLRKDGWTLAESPDEAELIIVNTCGFIEPAKKQSIEVILDYRARYPGKKILAAGCLTERNGAELAEGLSEADGFVGNRDLSDVPKAARLVLEGGRPYLHASEYGGAAERDVLFSLPGTVYVKIAEGCLNRCTYCAIPLIRGGLRSRPALDIEDEVRRHVSRGIFEINLVAQDSASYGIDGNGQTGLVPLLRRLLSVEGNFWIRLLYIHPDRFPEGLIDLCRSDRRLVPYFDLPFQHASKVVLHRMNRRGDAETNLALIRRIRAELPEAVLRSSFLLGFPGETEKDRGELAAFLESAALDWVGFFAYSEEEDTPAASFTDARVPARTVARWKKRLEAAQERITVERLARRIGTIETVLIEEAVQGEGLYLGRDAGQAPEVDGAVVVKGEGLVPGKPVTCRIIGLNGIDLDAVVVRQ